ncbi:MAG: class IV adenylate cyclase [bacterium]
MENIELKAKYPDLAKAKELAAEVGAVFQGSQSQIDIYFRVPTGRLKLRESSAQPSQLIYYQRPDATGLKTSDYQIYPVADAVKFKSVLGDALGVWQVVEKQRELYLLDEVRIHLDRVKELGRFIEFEGVVSQKADRAAVYEKVRWLVAQFQIPASACVSGSYSDLLGGTLH